MSVRKRVKVHGRVQGVFFRDSARREAERVGVAGWVRNCSDGTVEAVVEGDEQAVAQVVSWLGDGPRRADVERVEVDEEEAEGLSGFEVR